MRYLFSLWVAIIFLACEKPDHNDPFNPGNQPPPPPPAAARPASIGIVGDTADVQTQTLGGVVIMGGSTDVDAAFQWMISRSGGGDVVVIRASGTDAYNPYIKGLGSVNSVETLKIDSRRLAQDDGVARIIRNAEMLFIAGGDQSDYMEYWRDTKVSEAINYLMNVKKVPVGGTSAGAAILGNYYFSGERGSVTSDVALGNPYAKEITLYKDDFLKTPFLANVIVDQHFSQRERQGRMLVFLGRIMTDWTKTPYGIAVDEKTAVLIDDKGTGTVVGSNKASFLKTAPGNKPEVFADGKTVIWDHNGRAVYVTELRQGEGTFDVDHFQPAAGSTSQNKWWSTAGGKIFVIGN